MKRISIFLVSALAMMLCAGCGEDPVEVTGINVAKNSFSLAYGETVQIVATTVPENADNQTFTYTSSNESVATVSATGLITITGVGTATITVHNGNVTQTITVTGNLRGITVTPATVPTFTLAGQTVQLTATPDPNIPVTFVWTSSNPAVATVSSDGLVTSVDEGSATITVSVGDTKTEVLVSVGIPQVIKDIKGWWKFDDPTNFLKATVGNDLELGGWDDKEKSIAVSAGPTADNGAINIPRFNYLKCIHGLLPNGPEGSTNVNEFTIMFDVMEEDASKYHALIQNEIDANMNNINEASIYLKSGGRIGTGQIGDSPNGTTENGKWYRVIFTVKGTADESGYYDYYLNGELLKENTVSNLANNNRHTLKSFGVIFFSDSRPDKGEGGDGYDFTDDGLHVAEIAIWDRPLTAAEIAQLGMFEVDE